MGKTVPVTGDALGAGTEDAVKRLRAGEVLLLENLRFHVEEEQNDPEFAKALAAYADVYVNDAFGTAHRAHASTVGIAKLTRDIIRRVAHRTRQAAHREANDTRNLARRIER